MKIAVIGHMALDSGPIALPSNADWARNQIRTYNYVRLLEDGHLIDHLDFLGQWRGKGEHFSIWDMHLNASLLLGAHLRRAGFETHVINAMTAADRRAKMVELSAYDPDLVVMGTTFMLSRGEFMGNAAFLRAAAPDAFIIAGGQHVFTTLLHMEPEKKIEYFEDSGVDAFVEDAQGEGTLLKVVEARAAGGDLAGIPNLIFRDAAGKTVVTLRLPEENPVTLLQPDFQGVRPGEVVHVRTARSCSFKCAFCTYPSVAGPLALAEVDVAADIFARARAAQAGAVVFTDDTFNVPPERFVQLLDRLIAQGGDVPWYSFLRCQYLDEPMVAKMKQSGCAGVFLGIESGSDRILKNMKKGAVTGFYRDGIRWLKEAGIPTFGAFVVGFPGETDATVAETQAFIEQSGLDFFFLQPFFYLSHAPIAKRAEEFGLTGNGLFWSHNSMNWSRAVQHINRMVTEIKGPTFVNPDYNLWEYAYLRARGLSDDEFRAYRAEVNRRTLAQMHEYALISDPGDQAAPSTVTSPRQ